MMGVNVSEKNRARTASILALAIYIEKRILVIWADFYVFYQQMFQLAAVRLVLYCSDTFILIIYLLESIVYPKEWFVCIVKEVCWIFGVCAQC